MHSKTFLKLVEILQLMYCISELLQCFIHPPQLFTACALGDVETIQQLISGGVDVNAVGNVRTWYLVSSNGLALICITGYSMYDIHAYLEVWPHRVMPNNCVYWSYFIEKWSKENCNLQCTCQC